MQDPYQVLDLPRDADSDRIRSRYLELVRLFPPEKEPQQFAAIRAAYDALRDPVVRLRNQLFDFQATQSLEGLVEDYRGDVRQRRLPTALLLSLAQP